MHVRHRQGFSGNFFVWLVLQIDAQFSSLGFLGGFTSGQCTSYYKYT